MWRQRYNRLSYWADSDGDGLIDEGEVWADAATAPPGAIAMQNIEGGAILNSTTVTTATGTLTAYSVGLDFDPDGLKVEIDGNDLVVSHEDGRIDRRLLVQDLSGETHDLTGTGHAGAFGAGGGDTLVTGGDKSVWLFGLGGGDSLSGGNGDDILAGGLGIDSLSGGRGDDFLFVDADDLLGGVSGGDGRDTLFVETAA